MLTVMPLAARLKTYLCGICDSRLDVKTSERGQTGSSIIPAMTNRIPIYETTDRAYILELAADPTVTLDISAIATPQVMTATLHQPLLPAHIRAGLYLDSDHVLL